jgi:hypothetical protein
MPRARSRPKSVFMQVQQGRVVPGLKRSQTRPAHVAVGESETPAAIRCTRFRTGKPPQLARAQCSASPGPVHQ